MANQEFIVDNGLFIGKSDFNFSLPESYETISNILKTIKEYRDFTQPDSATWEEYVLEFFHILGFNTQKLAPRILALRDIGANGKPRALVVFIRPGENFDEIVPGLDWLSYLFYAASYHTVEWGLLTNGLLLKVVNINNSDYQQNYFRSNIDSVIENSRSDSFLTIYKVFSFIRGRRGETIKREIVKKRQKKVISHSEEYDLHYHIDGIPQQTIDIYEALRSKIMSLSEAVIEKFHKMYVGYSSNKNFCEIRILKYQLIIWVNISIDELADPLSICRDVRKIGHYGTGKTEIRVHNMYSIESVFNIIKQSFEKDRQIISKKRGRDSTEVDNPRLGFWKQLIDKAKSLGLIKGNKSPNAFNWISIASGKSGLTYDCVLRKNDAEVQLYIDLGDAGWNKNIFSNLYQHKEEIENVFEAPLDWQRLDTKRASRIRFVISDYGFEDIEHWNKLQDQLIEAMIRLQKAFQPFINQPA
jgi:predicted transport protein